MATRRSSGGRPGSVAEADAAPAGVGTGTRLLSPATGVTGVAQTGKADEARSAAPNGLKARSSSFSGPVRMACEAQWNAFMSTCTISPSWVSWPRAKAMVRQGWASLK